jgi:hypothetical protein
MALADRIALRSLSELLRGERGVEAQSLQVMSAENLTIPALVAANLLEQHIGMDLAEKATHQHYPSVHIYCEKVQNGLKEKFRRFSGTATLVVDVRVSHEHVGDLQQQLQVYVQSVTDVLDINRGNWGAGVYFTGAYEITYSPARRGGKNFTQAAQVRLNVQINLD